MGVVVTVNCDRCDSVIRSGVPDREMTDAPCDLKVAIPWYPHALEYADLCDGCRNAIVGYLASAFKLDRAVLTAQCVGNDGSPLKATKGEAPEAPALPLAAPKGKPPAKPPAEAPVAQNIEEVRRLAAAGEPLINVEPVTEPRSDLADANGVPTVKGAEMMFAAKDEAAAKRFGGPLPPSSDDDDETADHDREDGVTL